MKRVIIYLSFVSMILGIMAFQCSSAELTGAKLYIQQKQYDKAKEALQKEIEKNPASDEAYFLLGSLYGEENDIAKMKEAFDKSLSISKKFEKVILDANKYYWATSFNRGVGNFNKATKAENKDSITIFYEKAVNDFNNAIILEPDSVASYSNLVYAYFNMNRVDDAIPVLEKAANVAPSAELTGMLGQVYNEKGAKLMENYQASKNADDSLKAMEWYNKSIKVLEGARAKYPDDGDILLRLSNAYIGANKLDVAMNAFKAGVEQEPENKYYRYNYGVLLLNAKEYALAEEQFKVAVDVDPDYTNAVYNLAVTYVRWGAQMREEMEAKGEVTDAYRRNSALQFHTLKNIGYNSKRTFNLGITW
jgi:tetratricopeptide (TPR) repeat protein